MQTNITSIKKALTTLTLAAQETEALLSPALVREHWLRAKQGPNAWQEMSEIYADEPVLEVLAEIIACLNRLQGVVLRMEAQERPVDLRLVKMRKN